jgi:hypothetical protein
MRSGSSTPWHEWDGEKDDVPEAWTFDATVYYRDGWLVGDLQELAEALRADGVVYSLSWAFTAAESAVCFAGFYGYLADEFDPVRCNVDWETPEGDIVDEPPTRCIFALVKT